MTSTTASYAAWSEALLDVLLPVLPEERLGAPVLLSCDEETLVAAAEALGVDVGDPVAAFGRSVEYHYKLGATGSADKVRVDSVRFRGDPERARMVPPFLGVCAVMVLAASRMTVGEGMSASNYYERLWEVLARRPARHQYDFQYLPWLFGYLRDWLADDLEGRRGELLLAEGGPAHVGFAINQCVFRERDKEHLGEFFAERVGRSAGGVDLLRLLQVSSHRHRLTRRAQDALADQALQPAARAALAATFARWDGTRLDIRGGRSWQGVLHLAVNRGLRLSVSAPDAPPGLDLGDGQSLVERIPLDFAELADLSALGIRYGQPGRPGVFLPASGDTLVFEVREDSGLVWTRAPTRPFVHVFSRDPHLQRAIASYASRARGVGELPAGWQLYERVPAAQLPQELGAPAAAHARPPVALVGGLRIRNGWLVGHSPRIEVGDVEEPLSVAVDGHVVGSVAAGGDLALNLPEGDHRVDVGAGLVTFPVHMLARNPAAHVYGALRCALDGRGARTGASEQAREPNVCGASLSTPYDGRLPLMLRASGVLLITADGVSLRASAPPAPTWLVAVGLDPAGVRWEVPLDDDIAWALIPRAAIAVRPVIPDRLDHAARERVAALGRAARVRSLHRADRVKAQDGFVALVALSESGGGLAA